MAQMGLSLGYVVVMALNFVIVAGWLVLGVAALFSLRKRQLPATAQALWAVFVVVVPFLGALAYWIVRPSARREA
jgi:large-conductance mechanosensitive channel